MQKLVKLVQLVQLVQLVTLFYRSGELKKKKSERLLFSKLQFYLLLDIR